MAPRRFVTRRLRAEGLEPRQMFAAGDLDTTFNGTGFNIISQLSPEDEFATTMGIFPTAPGYIVLGGYRMDADRQFYTANSADTELVFVRPTGTLNTNIGTLGSIVTRVGLGDSRIAGIAFQEIAGTLYIVTAGYTEVSGNDLEFAATTIDPENPYTVASPSRPFRAEDVGSTLEILQDTPSGWLKGNYTIRAVDAATGFAMMNTAPATSTTSNVIVGGTWALKNSAQSTRPSTDILVSRYVYNLLSDSVTLDTTFGADGHAIIPVASGANSFDYAYAVAVDDFNRIVVAGYSQNSAGNYDFAVTRLVPNGDLDQTFYYASQPGGPVASRGHVMININGDDYANAVALGLNGEIYVAGSSRGSSSPVQSIIKLDQFGVPVATFDGPEGNGNGIVSYSRNVAGNGFINALQVYPADAGALAGSLITVGTNTGSRRSTVLTRIDEVTGELDSSFGSGGVVQRDLAPGLHDWGNSVVLQPTSPGNYGIVFAGSMQVEDEGYNMYVARLNSNGSADNTFYNGRFIHVLSELRTISAEGNDEYGATVLLDASGRLVLSGSSFYGDAPEDFDFTVLRFAAPLVPVQATVSGVSQAVIEHDSGVASITVELVLDRALNTGLTVQFATQDGTAIAGVDYQARSGSVTFGTGVTRRQVTIPLIGNTDYQANRSFSLVVTSATGAQVGSSAIVTIRDNDGSWQNLDQPEDVNGDTIIQPHDVLLLIDDLNRNGIRQLVRATSPPSLFTDVTGDTFVTPHDVLVVIDRINRESRAASLREVGAGGLAGSVESSAALSPGALSDTFAPDLVMVGYPRVAPAGQTPTTVRAEASLLESGTSSTSLALSTPAAVADAALSAWEAEQAESAVELASSAVELTGSAAAGISSTESASEAEDLFGLIAL